jgi:hypothetical protein
MPNTSIPIKMGQGYAITQDTDSLPPAGVDMSGNCAPAGSSMSRALSTGGGRPESTDDLMRPVRQTSGVSQDPMRAGEGAGDCPDGGM